MVGGLQVWQIASTNGRRFLVVVESSSCGRGLSINGWRSPDVADGLYQRLRSSMVVGGLTNYKEVFTGGRWSLLLIGARFSSACWKSQIEVCTKGRRSVRMEGLYYW